MIRVTFPDTTARPLFLRLFSTESNLDVGCQNLRAVFLSIDAPMVFILPSAETCRQVQGLLS
jgi:hypothetical protein